MQRWAFAYFMSLRFAQEVKALYKAVAHSLPSCCSARLAH